MDSLLIWILSIYGFSPYMDGVQWQKYEWAGEGGRGGAREGQGRGAGEGQGRGAIDLDPYMEVGGV